MAVWSSIVITVIGANKLSPSTLNSAQEALCFWGRKWSDGTSWVSDHGSREAKELFRSELWRKFALASSVLSTVITTATGTCQFTSKEGWDGGMRKKKTISVQSIYFHGKSFYDNFSASLALCSARRWGTWQSCRHCLTKSFLGTLGLASPWIALLHNAVTFLWKSFALSKVWLTWDERELQPPKETIWISVNIVQSSSNARSK